MGLNLDTGYHPAQDRLWLGLRGAGQPTHWWVPRRLLLAWVQAWLQQLHAVELPPVAGLNLPRDLAVEHRLSLEFDGPAPAPPGVAAPAAVQESPHEKLLHEVRLTVLPTGCVLVLRADGLEQTLELTRRESHALLDMLAARARAAGWLDAPAWPDWLGAGQG